MPVSVKVPGSVLTADNKPTEFDFIGQVRDSKGRIAASVRDGIKLKLPSQRSLLYDTGFTVPPGTYRLKFLVRESTSGKMGTFETRFTIPEQPAMSSVVWSSQREPLNAALASVEKNKKILANHPLIRDGQKLVPSVTRMFRASQKLYVYVEAYDPQGEAAATVSLFRGQYQGNGIRPSAGAGRRHRAAPIPDPPRRNPPRPLHRSAHRHRPRRPKVQLRPHSLGHSPLVTLCPPQRWRRRFRLRFRNFATSATCF